MKRATLVLISLGFVLGSCAGSMDDDAMAPCIPVTCKQLGFDCGKTPNGCDETLDCGNCKGSLTCGAAGPNKCGSGLCVAMTCETLKASCGPAGDGCGNVINCGDCPNGQNCVHKNGTAVCSGDTSASGGGAGAGGTGGMGASGGSGGTGGKGASGGNGGTGGMGAGSGTGGSGGVCDTTDFCQQKGYGSGWHCNGKVRVFCSTQGVCFKQTASETCPEICEGGVCKQDCALACSGRECGSVGACSCGSCFGNRVCNASGKCVDCISGESKTQSCAMSTGLCGSGTQSGVCVSNHWSWDQCVSKPKYVGDGIQHCGSGSLEKHDVLCLEIPKAGSDGPKLQARVSKVGGITFDNPVTLKVIQPSTGKTQHFDCMPVEGVHVIIIGIDMTYFTLPLDSTIDLEVRTIPCSGTWEAYSPTATVARCGN